MAPIAIESKYIYLFVEGISVFSKEIGSGKRKASHEPTTPDWKQKPKKAKTESPTQDIKVYCVIIVDSAHVKGC